MSFTGFMSPKRAARELGVPLQWLKREVREGRLPSLTVGRRVLVHPGDVEAALRQRTGLQPAEAAT